LYYSDFYVSEAEEFNPYGDVCGSVCSSDDDDDKDVEEPKKERKPADGMSPQTTGNEDEIEAEQAFDKQDEVQPISDDFYYNYEEHASKAAVSDESGLPPNLMTL